MTIDALIPLLVILPIGGFALTALIGRRLGKGAHWVPVLVIFGAWVIAMGLAYQVLSGAAPLLAAAQVIVYIGAISVLILFAIMLTQTKDAPSRLVFQTQAVPAAIASVIVAVLIALAVAATDWGELPQRVRLATSAMSRVLFERFTFPFEIVSVLLLAAVIGGVFLAKREPGGPS